MEPELKETNSAKAPLLYVPARRLRVLIFLIVLYIIFSIVIYFYIKEDFKKKLEATINGNSIDKGKIVQQETLITRLEKMNSECEQRIREIRYENKLKEEKKEKEEEEIKTLRSSVNQEIVKLKSDENGILFKSLIQAETTADIGNKIYITLINLIGRKASITLKIPDMKYEKYLKLGIGDTMNFFYFDQPLILMFEGLDKNEINKKALIRVFKGK